MIKKHLSYIAAYFAALSPAVAFAAAQNFGDLVKIAIGMVKSLVPLVIALSLLYFSWGLFILIRSNNENSREEAVTMITFGIVALFVMVTVWGLVNVLTTTFFSGGLQFPQLK